MAHDSESGVDKAWRLAEDIRFCMFITWDGDRQRARPMAAMPRKEEHAIYFLTSEESAKAWQAERFPVVSLAFADNAKHDYLAVTGEAVVTNDRAKIRDLWSPFDKAWWDSPDDPDIRLIKVSPDDAEIWDGPNGPVANVKMLIAAAAGQRPDMGDNRKVNL